MTLLQKIKCTEGVTVLRKTRRSIKPSSHASMQKSRDNEWCVGKQKSNKSTRDQNGAAEREREREKERQKMFHSRSLNRSRSLHVLPFATSLRNGFLFTARALHSWRPLKCAGLFLSVRRPNLRHISIGPISSVFRANRPEKRPRIEWKGIRPIET